MTDRLTAPLESLKITTASYRLDSSPSDSLTDSWDAESSASSDTDTPVRHSPSARKDYPRAPPPTPLTTSPTVPSTNWGAASAKFRGIDHTLDEADEDAYITSRAAQPSARKDSTRPSDMEPSRESSGRGDKEDKRPEKSTAVASRLIAAGLGVKAPRRTEEQREYDRAVKAQELKKREREKEEEKRKKDEAERAKQAIWDD